jgi:DNA uptake protein ComE-like DNA-binding protein
MRSGTTLLCLGSLLIGCLAGCGSAAKTEQTAKQETEEARKRADEAGREISKAVDNAKPELHKAGEQVGSAARKIADDAKAAVRGANEGWDKGDTREGHIVNLNSASEAELTTLPGISREQARKIISRRPYLLPEDTVRRGALTENQYEAIEERVVTK